MPGSWGKNRNGPKQDIHPEVAMDPGPRVLIHLPEPCIFGQKISLGDIHNLPTFWVLALCGNFYNFCFDVQTCRHLGGGGGVCVCFVKSVRKRRFGNVWVGGG